MSEAIRPLAGIDQRLPLAVAAIERQNLGPGGQPQHRAGSMLWSRSSGTLASSGKGAFDGQARAPKISGKGHRSTIPTLPQLLTEATG